MDPTTYVPISSDSKVADIAAHSQDAYQQPEGAGLRVANRAEFTLVAPVAQPGGPAIFHAHAAQAQAEAAYWEDQLGTVHDLRIGLVNNDQQLLFAATYSDEFKPYVYDVIKLATPWIDFMFTGVADGYPGLASPEAIPYILEYQVQAEVWYASNAAASVRDITRSLKLSAVFGELLDAAQG